MKPRTEVIATFNDLEKAQAVQSKLERAGFHAKVLDQSKLQKFIYLSKPLASEKVLVNEAEFEKARHFLEETNGQDHILTGEICCLKCGSPHIDYPQFTRKFITTTVFGVIASTLHLIDKTFYCQACHHTWPVTEKLRPRTDILNWPNHTGVVKDERG